ncbi:hypothetical protein ACFYRI_14565 [Streptomyces microflavus]|uniref:hypothetical protein n=1 Tax=Streptomyces microflavus TaxID=1919 RepID=UPI0036D1C8C6
MTAADLSRVDVLASQLTAEILTRRAARRVEPQLPECFHCGSRTGPWVPDPSGARWPSGAQVMECRDRCTAADPDRHSLDLDIDRAAALVVAAHPEACATEADYPGWPAQVAELIARSKNSRRTR